MPTIIIHDTPIFISPITVVGLPLSTQQGLLLNFVLLQKFRAKVNYFVRRNQDATDEQILAFAEEAQADLSLEDSDDGTDAVYDEALALAKNFIISRLEMENLPPPKNISLHAEAVLERNPEFLVQARKRVEARLNIGAAVVGMSV